MCPIDSPDDFLLTLWTADPDVVRAADTAGVHRIGVDLERLGKAARQAGRGTWISPHTLEDLQIVARGISRARLFARINRVYAGTRQEVEQVIGAGASVVMVPMMESAADAADVAGLVGGRAVTIALVESARGLDRLADICRVAGVDEVYFGLNDLALSLALPNRWAVLTGRLMTDATACVRDAGRPFGFGGIGRAGDTTLPIAADIIYAEYARLGARRALLARSFAFDALTAATDVQQTLGRLAYWRRAPLAALEAAHAELESRVSLMRAW